MREAEGILEFENAAREPLFSQADAWKLAYAHKARAREDSAWLFTLDVVGLRIAFHGSGMGNELADWLASYYRGFLVPNQDADVRIHLLPITGAEGNHDLPLWNEADPRLWLVRDRERTFVIERDFIAEIDPDIRELRVHCPRMSGLFSDVLDNVMVIVMSRHIGSVGGLVLHAATLVKDGAAYVFFGDSGVGKSTLAEFAYQCYGMSVIGADLTHLSLAEGRLLAERAPRKIPEFPLGHPALHTGRVPVRALFHLVQAGEYRFRSLGQIEGLRFFLRQAIPFQLSWCASNTSLGLVRAMLEAVRPRIAEFSYPLATDFWPQLRKDLTNLETIGECR